jgi:hypothetical protein
MTERKDLETLPGQDGKEGGWVELRRLSYGEKLQKDQEAMKMRFNMSSMGDGRAETNLDAEIAMINEYATIVEMSRCIMDHNLTDGEDGPKLDFNKPDDVRKLDPRVGEEINQLLQELNDFERKSKKSKVDAKTGK